MTPWLENVNAVFPVDGGHGGGMIRLSRKKIACNSLPDSKLTNCVTNKFPYIVMNICTS